MSQSSTAPRVCIVGAGPTGLVLALWLAKSGVRIRIVEKNDRPGTASRAMAVHARTLEFYRQLGFADEVIEQGLKMRGIRFRRGERVLVKLELGDIGEGLSPFPFVLSYPQDNHERLLLTKFDDLDLEVEWGTEFVSLTDRGDRVKTVLRTEAGESEAEFDYVVGCDGASSPVRHQLGLGFSGGTYEQQFFVVDVEASGPAVDGNINICLTSDTFFALFPIRSSSSCRIVGILPPEIADRDQVAFDSLRGPIEKLVGLRLGKENWFSTYRSHHRVADRFAKGRVFIAGDAGHVHSPAGGQGMNTGIGDAVNLGWKLAAVLNGKAGADILSSYEPERIRFAKTLVATTDRIFSALTESAVQGFFVRRVMLPFVAPLVTRLGFVRKLLFRTASQIRIEYTTSPLSVGSAGLPAGSRLPWVEGADNFDPLRSLDWQIHVYGQASRTLREEAARLGLPVHGFEWSRAVHKTGLRRDALYLVRPDGYVGFAHSGQDVERLGRYLERFGLTLES